MGVFRKTAYLASGGVISPHSRKQRTALQTLAAVQGASPAQVRKTGGRHDFDSVITGTPRVGQPDHPTATALGNKLGSMLDPEQAKIRQARNNRAWWELFHPSKAYDDYH